MRRWIILPAFLTAIGLASLGSPGGVSAQDAKAANEGESEELTTADGVLLKARFHAANKAGVTPGAAPVVIMMYAPGPDKDMTKNNWAELATDLTKNGYNVFRFDWRGHGQSKTIQNANKFWNIPLQGETQYPNIYTGPINQKYIKGFNKFKLKQDLNVREFSPGYFPVLVNDLAAVRVHLDQKNDRNTVNTSRVILIGEGEAATIDRKSTRLNSSHRT